MKIEIDVAKFGEIAKDINELIEDFVSRLKRLGVEVLSYNSIPIKDARGETY